jgi:L-iditol 2-dehydrogenase
MKAIYMESATSYELTERPMPEPRGDEVLVRVSHAGLCHTDVIIRSGKADHVLYPFIPGHEFAGVVEACGSLVYHLKPGDRVTMHSILGCGLCRACHSGDICSCINYDELGSRRDGGFAEYCSVPARWAIKLPDHVSLEEGALTEPLANACAVVRNCRIQEGDQVVIIGPGPIGILAAQVALLHQPSKVILLGTRDARLEIGRKAGATHLVNIRNDGAMEELNEILEGRGADVVMECAGAPDALEMAIEIAGRNARVAIEGSMGIDDTIQIYPRRILVKALQLIGICGWRTEDFNRAIHLMAASKVDISLIITQHFSLDEWEQAFTMSTKRKDETIKVEFDLS